MVENMIANALTIRVVVAAGFLFAAAGTAQAQISPFQGYRGPVLTKADLDAGKDAAGRLLGSDPKPVGAVESWTGPESGNAGTLTTERAFHKQGRDCRAIRSRVTYKIGTQRSFLLTTCRVGGDWKLM